MTAVVRRLTPVGLCVMQLCGPARADAQSKVRLLRTGTFAIAPPRILPNERWFGLQHVADQWTLTRSDPKIRPAKPLCDGHAVEISTGDLAGVMFLISGVNNMTEGPVTTTVQAPRVLLPGETLKIGGDTADSYSLEALGTATREQQDVVFLNYALWIRHGHDVQRLITFQRNALDNPRQLVWAGDIDRDRRPDLLFDFPLGDVGHNYVLYLSSARQGSQLVSRVASFSTPDC